VNVIDSSAWIEYLVDGPNAARFLAAIEDEHELLVPSIVIVEVTRWLLRKRAPGAAAEFPARLRRARVADLHADLATAAATAGIDHRLPLADSIVYATAQAFSATLWTQDADFAGLPGVEYFAKA
jgi:predicted nucleic acid-binding protein